MSKKNRGRFKGFLGGLYEFLHFRKIVIETILKIAYLILAIAVTLGSFAFIGQSFLAFLVILIVGNLSRHLMLPQPLLRLRVRRAQRRLHRRGRPARTAGLRFRKATVSAENAERLLPDQ